jgi:hypothetical protein
MVDSIYRIFEKLKRKMMTFDLNCIRGGKFRYFKGFYRDEGSEIRFILEDDENNPKTGYIVDFTIQHIDEKTMQVKNMYIDIDRYLGIGMPEALILKAKELFAKQIISSTNSRKDGEEAINECLSEKVKKVWIRLVDCRVAFYDPESDRYKTF